MSAESVLICTRCQAEWNANSTRCPVCGAPRSAAEEHAVSPELAAQPPLVASLAGSPIKKSGVADNPHVVLATIFLVTAAFGIPLIWMCPAWSRSTKWLLTWVTILYTILILAVFGAVMLWCYRRIMGG